MLVLLQSNKTVLTLTKLIQTILKGTLTNFSDNKVVSGLNVTGHYHAFGKKRKLIESDHLSSCVMISTPTTFLRTVTLPKTNVPYSLAANGVGKSSNQSGW